MRNAISIFPFLIFSVLGASLEGLEKKDEVFRIEKTLDLILYKLEDLSKEVDILESKLTLKTATKPHSKLSLEELVAREVKDFHTHMTLEMVSRTVSEIKQNQQEMSAQLKSLNETIIDQREDQKLQLKTLKKVIEEWKAEFTKVAVAVDDTPKKAEVVLATDSQDLHRETTTTPAQIEAHYNCMNALYNSPVSGVYHLMFPDMDILPFDAYCLYDEVDELYWTIIQRRQDGSVDFYRDWADYKHGFGNPEGEYWLGLEKIYAMTSEQPHELWIELEDWEGEKRHACYSHFEIGNEEEKYYLKSKGNYSGNAGDAIGQAVKTRRFTTRDADNDAESYLNCAEMFHGAWWYNVCYGNNLNNQYNNTEFGRGVNWYNWHSYEYSLKYVHMAIRPKRKYPKKENLF